MGNVCWDWRAVNRIPHFLNRSWKIETCPTNVCLYLSWSDYPSYAMCCLGKLLECQQQRLLMRRAHLQCHWTARKYEDKIFESVTLKFNTKLIPHEKITTQRELGLTHLPEEWTGPKPFIAVYSLKYWGMEKPIKTENPSMNFVRKLLRLQNWRKLKPAAPAQKWTASQNLMFVQKNTTYSVLIVVHPLFTLFIHTDISKEKAVQCSKYWCWNRGKKSSEFSCRRDFINMIGKVERYTQKGDHVVGV